MTDAPPAPSGYPEPRLVFELAGSQVWHGDCIETMALLPADSFDAVVTDPPYGLEFMGRAWDKFPAVKPSGIADGRGMKEGTDKSHPFRDGSTRVRYGRSDPRAFQAWTTDWAAQALRVLKPGGHLLAFGGSRTWHRLVAGIEDAGFDIRDGILWLYASGFPKSRDVSDAMASYVENGPVVVGPNQRPVPDGMYEVTGFLRAARDAAGWSNKQIDALFGTNGMAGHWTSQGSQPSVPSERQWEQLKEALGFDDSMDDAARRLGSIERPEDWGSGPGDGGRFLDALRRDPDAPPPGDWGTALKPAFEPIAVARKPFPGSVASNVLQYGTGAINIGGTRAGDETITYRARGMKNLVDQHSEQGDRPYEAGLPNRDEPEKTVEGRWPMNVVLSHAPECADPGPCMPGCPVRELGDKAEKFPAFRYQAKAPGDEKPETVDEQGNTFEHPTVKPLELMRWLARLVVPPRGRLLEPFAGSGTTTEAAVIEGFESVSIELGAEHLPLIEQRLMRQPAVIAERMERGEHEAPEGALW